MRSRRQPHAALVALPLALLGSLVAHSLAYRLAVPAAPERDHLLAATGHGYLEYAPLVLAGAVALVLVGFGARVAAAARGDRPPAAPGLGVALLPLLVFVLQEHLERLLHNVPAFHAALEPTFALGVVLQLGMGLLAIRVARALAELAHGLGEALGQPPTLPLGPEPTLLVVAVPAGTRAPVLAGRCAGRAPPSRA